LSSPVDPRFGRAEYFLVVDTETESATCHDNGANRGSGHGAGVRSSQQVVSLAAEAVVTGNIGPKALRALQVAGVAVYVGATGSVQDALSALKAGELSCAEEPTVRGHAE
jgi:predicted Fe-Mo cluster-binding NifX family protein